MPWFDNNTLASVEAALHTFHVNKSTIITAGARRGSNGPLKHWEIPKLKLLQNVVASIQFSGATMQRTADVTEHAHVTEIKQPTCSGNNQVYYTQIAQHLDHSDKCFQFDVATQFASIEQEKLEEESDDQEDEHEPDSETCQAGHYYSPACTSVNYFKITENITSGAVPNTSAPPNVFTSSTTAFWLVGKPSLQASINEASEVYGLPDLCLALTAYFSHLNCSMEAAQKMQIWFKVQVQQWKYHDRQSFELPQSLLASPPPERLPYGQYDFAIVSQTDQSDWPSNGLTGMFCSPFLVYIFTALQGILSCKFSSSSVSFTAIHTSLTLNDLVPLLPHRPIRLMLLLVCMFWNVQSRVTVPELQRSFCCAVFAR